jgi:hypothetical protein
MVRDLIGPGAAMANVCVSLEAEASTLGSEEEITGFLKELGMEETGLAQVVRHSTDLLGMHTFYTVGPKETRAWDLRLGATAPQAAGVIHSDFERGFIRAEVIAYQVSVRVWCVCCVCVVCVWWWFVVVCSVCGVWCVCFVCFVGFVCCVCVRTRSTSSCGRRYLRLGCVPVHHYLQSCVP